MIKVAITGPEASGKSTLTKALANHFRTSYAPEFAREYLERKSGKYDREDLDFIIKGQIKNEEDALNNADQICFFDTDMLVVYIWSSFRFGQVSVEINQALKRRSYDIWLLCKPDLPWEEDVLRESPDQNERNQLFAIYRDYLQQNHPDKFAVIEGIGSQRFQKALDFLGDLT